MSDRIWEYVDALSHTKDERVLDEPDFDKHYNAFIVNRALSYHADSVLAAEMMNQRASLDPKSQFRFFLNTLRPRRRIAKWVKPTDSGDVATVAEYYEISMKQARVLVSLHTPDQITAMRVCLDKGGVTTRRQGRSHEPSG